MEAFTTKEIEYTVTFKACLFAVALTRGGTHPVTMGGPYTVIVRVFWLVRWQFQAQHAGTATGSLRARPADVSQHVIMHQISALPC